MTIYFPHINRINPDKIQIGGGFKLPVLSNTDYPNQKQTKEEYYLKGYFFDPEYQEEDEYRTLWDIPNDIQMSLN